MPVARGSMRCEHGICTRDGIRSALAARLRCNSAASFVCDVCTRSYNIVGAVSCILKVNIGERREKREVLGRQDKAGCAAAGAMRQKVRLHVVLSLRP